MKRIISLLMLFACVLPITRCAEAAALSPLDPTPKDFSFVVAEQTQVQLCVVGSNVCGTPVLIQANQQTNCGLGVKDFPIGAPAGSRYECRAVVVQPPPVETPLPDGWLYVGDGGCDAPGCTFDVNTRMDVKLCDASYKQCSSPRTFFKAPGVHYLCMKGNFADFPAGFNPYRCLGKLNPVVDEPLEMPDFADPKLSDNYDTFLMPDTVSDRWDVCAVWKTKSARFQIRCGGAEDQAQVYAAMIVDKLFKSNDAVNAWAKTRLVEEQTEKENTFMVAQLKAFQAKFAPKYVVQTSSTTLRPYYPLNAAKTALGAKKGDVSQGTLCDCNQRFNATYCVVPSVSTESIKYYSVCFLVK
jgi:hypothetical protein